MLVDQRRNPAHLSGDLVSPLPNRPVRIHGVEELNIGFSIISRALLVGMERAVREMKELLKPS